MLSWPFQLTPKLIHGPDMLTKVAVPTHKCAVGMSSLTNPQIHCNFRPLLNAWFGRERTHASNTTGARKDLLDCHALSCGCMGDVRHVPGSWMFAPLYHGKAAELQQGRLFHRARVKPIQAILSLCTWWQAASCLGIVWA
eukprot:1157604-Pelagomonas_calceolata.AAC.3